jgi:hypothetical protein
MGTFSPFIEHGRVNRERQSITGQPALTFRIFSKKKKEKEKKRGLVSTEIKTERGGGAASGKTIVLLARINPGG